jgi:hypothetical protein
MLMPPVVCKTIWYPEKPGGGGELPFGSGMIVALTCTVNLLPCAMVHFAAVVQPLAGTLIDMSTSLADALLGKPNVTRRAPATATASIAESNAPRTTVAPREPLKTWATREGTDPSFGGIFDSSRTQKRGRQANQRSQYTLVMTRTLGRRRDSLAV